MDNNKNAVMSEFEQIISCILSTNKELRAQGERTLQEQFLAAPAQLAQHLVLAMDSRSEDIAGLSSVLLRKYISEEDLLTSLPEDLKATLKSSLLSLMCAQKSQLFLKRLADVIAGFAVNHNWAQELMFLMGTWSTHESAAIRQVDMYLFELCMQYEVMREVLEGNSSSVLEILWGVLQDPDTEVQLAAGKTLCLFLAELESEELVVSYAGSLQGVLGVLSRGVLDSSCVEPCVGCLSSICELSITHPRVWISSVSGVVTVMSGLAKAQEVPLRLRSCAVEVLSILSTKLPKFLSKDEYFVKETVSLAFLLLAEVPFPFDLESWNKENSGGECFTLGKELVSTLAINMGEAVYPYMMQMVQAHLAAPHWVRQHAGVIALGFIAEGCAEGFRPVLGDIVNWVVGVVSSENPRLRWAALTTLALFCTEFSTKFLEQYSEQVMQCVFTCLGPGNCPKVQTQAAGVIVNYSQQLQDKEYLAVTLLVPYVPTLFSLSYSLLTAENSSYSLLKELVDAICIVSTVIGAEVSQFYALFIPGLHALIATPTEDSLANELRSSAIRCASCITESVAEFPEFTERTYSLAMQILAVKQAANPADPVQNAVREAIPAFACALKDRFLPYLEPFVQEILALAAQEIDVKYYSAESSEALEVPADMYKVNFELKGVGKKQLAVRTEALEQKICAVKILYDLVVTLETRFSPYMGAALSVLFSLFNCPYNSEIRKYAVKTVGHLAKSCEGAVLEEMTVKVLPFYQETIKTSHTKKHFKDTLLQMRSFCMWLLRVENISIVGLVNAHALAKVLAGVLSGILERTSHRKAIQLALNDAADCYSEELEELAEQQETDNSILKQLLTVLGVLLKGFKRGFHSCFSELFQNPFGNLLYDTGATEEEILCSLCMFDDLVEYTGDILVKEKSSILLEKFISFTYHENCNIRQAAAYGIGLCAQYGDSSVFTMYKDLALQAIQHMLRLPRARDRDLVSSECAVGALGKIALGYELSLLPEWLSWMPLRAEPDEAKSVNELFLRNIDKVTQWKDRVGTICSEIAGMKDEYLSEDIRSLLSQVKN